MVTSQPSLKRCLGAESSLGAAASVTISNDGPSTARAVARTENHYLMSRPAYNDFPDVLNPREPERARARARAHYEYSLALTYLPLTS